MKLGQLRDYFAGAGVKRLSAVDAESARSNQHEIGTTREMRSQFLGEVHRQEYRTIYVLLPEDEEVLRIEGVATHYDARRQKNGRGPEWRLYYPSNPVTEAMRAGDALFLAKGNDGLLYFLVAPAGSTGERQLSWLFDLGPNGQSFLSREVGADGPDIDFAARWILDSLGISLREQDTSSLDEIVGRFDMAFPTTRVFSDLARTTLPEVSAVDDPDEALIAWLDREEAMFMQLEHRIVQERLQEGFAGVESFISYSLRVQNRRKSRMGYSLENHLEAVFTAFALAFDRGAVTEDFKRPDFLFPGIEAYRNAPDTGDPSLTMLGAKASCKERWRQVEAEASKIPEKHLLTLEAGISEAQTDQMKAARIQLVVPRSIHHTYTGAQRAWLWNLAEFIRDVRARSGG